eukprot:TRINITY_DN5731_c0_g1_i1.p1 TRINITY_DN5731_c0_g1~~TRINITY_DN5731_c0_g1_i1.p1  ORF type:complete len:433 (+),score=33.93 TRINITY_DN5731_c0_g1_i1:67-1365(+)
MMASVEDVGKLGVTGRHIILGVTGSISCYKCVSLASHLTQLGALVDVVLTEAAQKFVTPLTFSSVTGRKVYTDLWSEDGSVAHVRLGESADLYVIVPATANTISKLAAGSADNFLLVTALAARCPLVVCPAMDGGMYSHPAVQANIATLESRGVVMLGPCEGRMASGLVGMGRLLEPAQIIGHIRRELGRKFGSMVGKRVVVTAGPTRERADPVRFISNRSTGKQGVAIAQASIDEGADVTLITGPIESSLIPFGLQQHVSIESALELRDAVLVYACGARGPCEATTSTMEAVKSVTGPEQGVVADVLIMTAAVGDFRPANPVQHKIKKTDFQVPGGGDGGMRIDLVANPDILLSVKEERERQKGAGVAVSPVVVVGFAAETRDVVKYGRDKLKRKGLDFIAINDVSDAQSGFGVDTNRVVLLGADGTEVIL